MGEKRLFLHQNFFNMKVGDYNLAKVIKHKQDGYVVKSDGKIALLPQREADHEMAIGEELNVFVYTSPKGELLATLQQPKIKMGEFVALEVKENSGAGTFVDWGLRDDLLIPYDEQDYELEEGKKYVTRLYVDEKSNRLRGTTIFYDFMDHENVELVAGDEVDLLVVEETDLGITVIINGKHEGLLYQDEVYDVLEIGSAVKGYIKKIRSDQKIDVTLHKFGYRKVEPNAQKILDKLKANDGFLGLHDKSDPEEIRHQMGMSKKIFKKAIGSLYKQRLIAIEQNGIKLN